MEQEQTKAEEQQTPPQPEETQQQPQQPQRQQVMPIELDEKGRVMAKNNAELIRYCGALIDSGMVPARFDKPGKLFGAISFVRSLGLPDNSIRQVANIEGTPSLFGDLPLALCQATGELTHFEEKWFDKDYNFICFENKNLHAEVFGAVCFISRSKCEKQSFAFTMDDAKAAGLYPPKKRDGSENKMSPWNKYTKLMLRYKARAIGLKSLFADKINGVAIAEYDFDENDPTNARDITPEGALANELNKITA